MRDHGTLWLPKGSHVWWGRYYRNGKPQTFNTEERSATKTLQAKPESEVVRKSPDRAGRRAPNSARSAEIPGRYSEELRRRDATAI
jgi:hypothetical protein